MLAIDGSTLDFKRLDRLALQNTVIHRIDARVKVVTTIVFIICVVSFDRYTIAAMLPFLSFPIVLSVLGNLPPGYLLRKLLLVIPFALAIGLFNPLFDRQVVLRFGELNVWGGWVSCASILLRAILTASTAIILVAVTGFPAICAALQKLGMPQVFAIQLQFLYRYIFVLTDEAVRVARSRQLRSFGRRGLGLHQFGSLIGHLLLRTWERAERIHMAMLSRGFQGEFQATWGEGRLGRDDLFFISGWSALFVFFRFYNLPQFLGNLMTWRIP
ncbi:MAG: cobalt ECF transporter T component CbiQ [Deltaproteobacteria bacterium]|jgi:cobalt/nickel transport system permease protein|nr:cobalt ECF transporter T component CbiQ [Deltaproteobacteria bacterium]